MIDDPTDFVSGNGSGFEASQSTRLVGFLGAQNYKEATYALNNMFETGSLMPVVLAKLLGCKRVSVLATSEAEAANGQKLRAELEALGVELDLRRIPSGRSEDELQDQFRVFRDLLIETADGPLAIDITLGFRIQPFFAAAGLSVLAATGRLSPDTRIYYGAFDDRDGNTSPIWELTGFLDMIDFAMAAAVFRQSGDGRPLANALERERNRKNKRQVESGTRQFARAKVIEPLRSFSSDLAATRVASLLVGVDRDGKIGPASAARLHQALNEWREECNIDHPALVPMLDDLLQMTDDLLIDPTKARLSGLADNSARPVVAALAKLYMTFGRLMEAAAVAREETISRLASHHSAKMAGRQDFDEDKRKEAERIASESLTIRSMLDWRNDLLHAGMRRAPQPGKTLGKLVSTLVEQIERPPITVVVARHEGALEWLADQGIVGDKILEHLDETDIADLRAGDHVVGVLPVELIARLCGIGAVCEVLVVALTHAQRGTELTAVDMKKAGARLVRIRAEME